MNGIHGHFVAPRQIDKQLFTSFRNLHVLLEWLLLLLDCTLDGNEGDHLSLHLVHLGHQLAHHLVHLRLIVDVQLGKSEKGDPCEDDESEGVEPGTDVSEQPKGKTKLDRVHHGLDQEESPQLKDGSVDGGSKARGGR